MASTWSTLKYIKHYRAELIQDDSTHEPVMSVTDKTKVKTSCTEWDMENASIA